MAEKRITTVDEVMAVDENADYILISRGVQRDLRRLLLRRLPQSFDLHDSVTDELTTLAGIDRLLVSDEGTPGAPQKFVKLATLRSFLLDLFDLHDDVPAELTDAANDDRLLISDEDQPGDPQKWISVKNLAKSLPGIVTFEKLTDEIAIGGAAGVTITHSLGRVPVGFQGRLLCKTAEHGYAAGDEVYLPLVSNLQQNSSRNGILSWGFGVYDVTDSNFKVRSPSGSSRAPLVPQKTTDNWGVINMTKWRFGLTIWG